MADMQSPAVAIVGRHNSGKTTLVEKLIGCLVGRGLDVGSIKHHSHKGFDIDYPGKDSYRHRAAGASDTIIAAPGQVARIKTVEGEVECDELVRSMPGHDVIIVEGYRKSGLPTIEIMRSGNEADVAVAESFIQGAREGLPLGTDFTQLSRGDREYHPDLPTKMPTSSTIAVVTDIPEAAEAAATYGIPAFGLEDIDDICDYLQAHYVRPRITVVIQAGGQSRRMGESKATVLFDGRPLICRLIERLSPVADQLVITTNEAERLGFIDEMYPELGITLVADEGEMRGALPGLHTALKAAKYNYVAVIACDMVFASAALVVGESLMMAETGADVVVPVNKFGYEPFHALYNREGCLAPIEDLMAQGEKRAQALFGDKRVTVAEFSRERVLEVEPRGGCFINVNTPEELKRVQDSYLGE